MSEIPYHCYVAGFTYFGVSGPPGDVVGSVCTFIHSCNLASLAEGRSSGEGAIRDLIKRMELSEQSHSCKSLIGKRLTSFAYRLRAPESLKPGFLVSIRKVISPRAHKSAACSFQEGFSSLDSIKP